MRNNESSPRVHWLSLYDLGHVVITVIFTIHSWVSADTPKVEWHRDVKVRSTHMLLKDAK